MSSGDFGALAIQTRDRLNALWSEVGLSEDERDAELEIIVASVRSVYNSRLQHEERHVEELRSSISTVTAQLKAILTVLEAPASEVAAVDCKPRGVSLRDKVSSLKQDLAAVAERRDARAAAVTAKHAELLALWSAMGFPAKAGFEPESQTEDNIGAARLAALTEEVAAASAEQARLQSAVQELCQEINDQFTELGIASEMDVQANDSIGAVISANPRVAPDVASVLVRLNFNELDTKITERRFELIGVHAATIKALQERTVLLAEMRTERTEKLHEFAQAIMPLWRRLSVPAEEQQAWVKNNGGLSIQALRSCQLEIIRLQQLQQEALGPMLQAARAKVEELWDHLMVSADERALFKDFTSPELSDELLQSHEQHISLLTARANAMRPVLELIARRDELKRTTLVLAEMETDPDRYKKPRHLIEEERLRKQLRAMPKLEAELRAQIPAWEAQYGEFRVDGVRFLDLMEEDIEAEHARKEEDRLAKERERDAKRAGKAAGAAGANAQPFGRTSTAKAGAAAAAGGNGTRKGTAKGTEGKSKENVCA